ncbi:MAG TPA: acyl-ACP--UDP-N-acetylglucosamine O-acyltransferase [Methyloceanibacter sp.]|nr:acyl-ACP--UDP-N-acetylglucosamine O-acyltransferase [Methyloceanibacter sp.]
MANVHPTALVDSAAQLGADVTIGPFCVVGPDVTLGDRVEIHSHVLITGRTTVGEGCRIFPFATLGTAPQDVKYKNEPTRLEIGANTVIREQVTINPGTINGDGVTRVGANCFLLIGAHIAHDCQVGDNVTMVNHATLAGHVSVGDRAILGGLCAVHQFVRIGAHAFIGGMSGITADVIPFGMAVGNRATLRSLNLVGLRRGGYAREDVQGLRAAYRFLFGGEGTLAERLAELETTYRDNPLVQRVVAFMQEDSDRSYTVPSNGVTTADDE